MRMTVRAAITALVAVTSLFGSPLRAESIKGYGPWHFGMSPEEVEAIEEHGPYKPVQATGGLETARGSFAGEDTNVSFVFGAGGLWHIQVWAYTGPDFDQATHALHRVYEHLLEHHGPLHAHGKPLPPGLTIPMLVSRLPEELRSAGSVDIAEKLKKEGGSFQAQTYRYHVHPQALPAEVEVYGSMMHSPQLGLYWVFLYYRQPELRDAIAATGNAGSTESTAKPAVDPAKDFPPAQGKILLLGTFHFKDAGLDSYKPQHDVDVLSEKRQKEVARVVDCLLAFEPTRIAVERRGEHQQKLDEQYRAYRKGEFELTSNEIHQLGFRLAARRDHPGVYAVDARGRHYEPYVDPDEYAAAHGQKHYLESPWDERFTALYRHDDELKTRQTLREHLLYINEEKRILQGHGHYLIDTFKVGDAENYPGVDSRTAWYNRNLRIFANLLRLAERPDERILLIIGGGHLPILRHVVEASPEFELVEPSAFLGEGCPDTQGHLGNS